MITTPGSRREKMEPLKPSQVSSGVILDDEGNPIKWFDFGGHTVYLTPRAVGKVVELGIHGWRWMVTDKMERD